VDLADPVAQDLDPVLRPAPANHVADVEVGLDKRAVELVDVASHGERLDEERGPDVFDEDVDLLLLGVRNRLADRLLRAPVVLHERAVRVGPHDVEYRRGAVDGRFVDGRLEIEMARVDHAVHADAHLLGGPGEDLRLGRLALELLRGHFNALEPDVLDHPELVLDGHVLLDHRVAEGLLKPGLGLGRGGSRRPTHQGRGGRTGQHEPGCLNETAAIDG